MKLAIVGSLSLRDSIDAQALIERLLDELKPEWVISGGADGIDTMAVSTAQLKGIETKEYLPKARNWPAFKARNIQIAQACDRLVAIRDPESRTYGSGWTADYAEKLGKPVQRHMIIWKGK